MEIVKNIILVLHLLSFAALFGLAMGQLKPALQGEGKISKGMVHSALSLLITGLALVGMVYATGGTPNNFKIAVKTLVLLVIFALVLMGRKKDKIGPVYIGNVTGLLMTNVVLAVMW